MSQFNNKSVIITGAAGALGQAVAEFFKNEGAKVAHVDYSDELLAKTFPNKDSDNSNLYIAADLTNRESTAAAIDNVAEKFGTVDVLVNIAGGFIMGEKVHETSDKTWDFLFNLNTKSIIHTTASAVPVMLKNGGGKVVNISAGAAKEGAALMGPYIASKSAVWRLTESMAQELRADNINVNCILPGMIDTARNRSDMPDADFSTWVPPSDIAETIGFLASNAAKSIHGAGIPVFGLS